MLQKHIQMNHLLRAIVIAERLFSAVSLVFYLRNGAIEKSGKLVEALLLLKVIKHYW